jgi:serine O-acetyltransferase
MIKNLVKNILFYLTLIWFSPLLILFSFSNQKNIIWTDVKRWVEILDWSSQSDLVYLLHLLKEAPEFRNLYYFRLFQGNFAPRLLMFIFKIIYQPSPSLFLDTSCRIGSGFFIQHGFSTIIMADLGDNCWVNQQVTIGYKDKTGRPKIGNNVRITAGAKILGNIIIGDNVTVGANAVVVKNVPDNCTVVGVPAYIVQRDGIRVKEDLI